MPECYSIPVKGSKGEDTEQRKTFKAESGDLGGKLKKILEK